MRAFTADRMPVQVYESAHDLGAAAAREVADILRTAATSRQDVAIILATGNSQLSFLRSLRTLPAIPWARISIFHMDEYVGMSDEHPAGFRRYMREQLVDIVHPRAFYGLAGNAADLEVEMTRYAALLEEHRPQACVLGIGENGHLAFNDPPAAFETDRVLSVVTLDEACRRQQVGEGHFATLGEVPRQAITLTIPALLMPPRVLAVVPEKRKASAVQRALEGPVTPVCPASILRTRPHVRLFLDHDSASLLRPDEVSAP